MIYTAQRQIAKLKNNRAARLVEEGTDDGAVWARFELRTSVVGFRPKKRSLTSRETRRSAGFAVKFVFDRRRGVSDGSRVRDEPRAARGGW